ncbi:TPA: hypothetical protein QDC06_006810 [Burkholderia cepacia]|nr:hypothetical protein [Burkholderia cepacia]
MMLTTRDDRAEQRMKHPSRHLEMVGPLVPVTTFIDQRFADVEEHGFYHHRVDRVPQKRIFGVWRCRGGWAMTGVGANDGLSPSVPGSSTISKKNFGG